MQELARVSKVLLVNEKCFFDRNGTNFSDFEQKLRQKQQNTVGDQIHRILAKVSNFSKFVKKNRHGRVLYDHEKCIQR